MLPVRDVPPEGVARLARAVLWDLDGTLVDSEAYHWRAWRQTLASEGATITYAQFLGGFGQKNERILKKWFGDDMPAEWIQRIGDAKEAEYRRLAESEGLIALPGAIEWMDALHEAGWKQAVASSAPRANVDTMLRVAGLDRHLDVVVAAEDVRAGKPDPEVFLLAAARLGVEPRRSIVVEDAAAGIEAARRAGIKCIGVHPSAQLPADVFTRSLTDLPPDAFDAMVPR